MNPFFTAFMPSVAASASGGLEGALAGEMAGEQQVLKDDALRADTEWKRAHAAGYGAQNRVKQQAWAAIQAGMLADPNYLNTPAGRLNSIAYSGADLGVNDSRIGSFNALTGQRQAQQAKFNQERATIGQVGDARTQELLAHADRYVAAGDYDGALALLADARRDTVDATRQPTIDTLTSKADVNNATTGLTLARTDTEDLLRDPRKAVLNSQVERNLAMAKLQGLHGNLLRARTDALRAANDPNAPSSIKNNAQLIVRLTDDLRTQMQQPGFDPDSYDFQVKQWELEHLVEGKGDGIGYAGMDRTPIVTRGPNKGKPLVPPVDAVPKKEGYIWNNPAVPARPPMNTSGMPKPVVPPSLNGQGRPAPNQPDQSILAEVATIKDKLQGDLAKAEQEYLKMGPNSSPSKKLAVRRAIDYLRAQRERELQDQSIAR